MRSLLLALSLFAATSVFAAEADLSISVDSFDDLLPGGSRRITGYVSNSGSDDAGSVTIQIRFPETFTYTGKTDLNAWNCDGGAGRIDCALTLPAGTGSYFAFNIQAASTAAPGSYGAAATIAGTTHDPVPANNTHAFQIGVLRSILVTRTADSGPGSFRAALEEANRFCDGSTRCEVVFDFPGEVTSIDVFSPLPVITATNTSIAPKGFFAGSTVTKKVELNGSRVASGSGLVLRSASTSYQPLTIVAMVINGFPDNGIQIDDSGPGHYQYSIGGCYIGTDAEGVRAIPNGGRGIQISAPAASSYIAFNTISGNGRSGIFLWAGLETSMSGNRIGVAANANDPLPNGAAGIYVSKRGSYNYASGGVIAFNRGPGIAIERGTVNMVIHDPKIAENWGPDIDWGLDGASARGEEGIPDRPVLTSATYDAFSNTTTILGDAGSTCHYCNVLIFASEAVNRYGTTPLAQTISETAAQAFGDHEFAVKVRGDFRGLYLSAVTYDYLFPDLPAMSTSEPSLAIQVPKPD